MTKTLTTARAGKSYTVAQAAALAGTSPQNVRRWLAGYKAPGHEMKPVFGDLSGESRLLSFLQLAEVIVVARFRSGSGRSIRLKRLRSAHEFARKVLKIEHPFASRQFKVEGGHIMHDFEAANPGPGKLAVDLHGNYVLPIELGEAMELFDFDRADGFAERWYPLGRDVPVVVDPDHAAGRPVVAGSNVRVEVLHGRWKSGESISELSIDFELPEETIEQALQAAA